MQGAKQMFPHFNIAIVCSSSIQWPTVEEALKQFVDNVEIAYYYDQSVSCSGTGYTHRIVITITCASILGSGFELVDTVGIVVLGHFSIDRQLKEEHFMEKHHNIAIYC